MARLYTSGFEIANDSAGHEWTNAGVSGAGRDTSVFRTGAASGRCSGLVTVTQAGWGVQFAAAAGNGPYYARFYLRIDTNPSADNCIAAFIAGANVTSTSANDAQIRLSSTGTLKLFANNSQVGSASSALSTGTWYRIELEADNGPAAGSKIIRGYLDGTQFAGTSSSSDIGGTISGIAVGGNLIAEAQTTGDWYFDDVAVNDNTGSFQTSLPGPGKVIVIRPNAAGDSNAWNNTANGAGSGNNYQLVDETSPNDATDMVQSGTLNNLDLYNHEASGLSSTDTINCVQVWFRRRNNVADATTAVNAVVIKTASGTQSNGTAVVPNTTTWRTGSSTTANVIAANHTSYQDPDGAAWTSSTVDSMQAGPKLTTANVNRIQVSAVWVSVDYNPATTVTPAAIANITALPATTLSAASTVTASVFAAPSTFPAVTTGAGSTPTPAAIAAPTTLPAVTASGSSDGNATATPAVLAAPTSLPAVTASASSTAEPASITAPTTLPAVTTSAGSTPTPAVLAAPTALPAVTVSAGSTPTPAVLAAPTVSPSATASASSTATPAVLAVPTALPVVAASGGIAANPASIAAPTTVPAVTVQANSTASPAASAAPTTLPAVSLSAGSTATLAAISAPTTLPAVTATGIGEGTAAPTAITTTTTFPAATVQADSAVTPDPVSAVLAFPAVSLSAGGTATPQVLQVLLSMPAVYVLAGIHRAFSDTSLQAVNTSMPVVDAEQTATPTTGGRTSTAGVGARSSTAAVSASRTSTTTVG